MLAGGGRWIWFRDRDMAADERRVLGRAVADVVRAAGGFLTVGGDVELAGALGADGVHMPLAALPGARERVGGARLIGVSAHSLSDVAAATEAGADYVTLSPIFPTASKPGYGPDLGPGTIAAAQGFGLPVIALGGIAAENLTACRQVGAAGFAVMGGVMRADDPGTVVRRLLGAWHHSAMDEAPPRPALERGT